VGKCVTTVAFSGASAKYFGERNEVLAKKCGDEWQKERFSVHASLCGGGNLLKALGSVAHYLSDRLLNRFLHGFGEILPACFLRSRWVNLSERNHCQLLVDDSTGFVISWGV